ncbi:MAG: hypothetical protein PF489_12360 [Salinivirgaceae bacterium]|jgi:hypothetical protein|nr:hypothetical protein [Salinivirgaceae bacterium]
MTKKAIILLSVFASLLLANTKTLVAQEVLVEKKSKIITYENDIILTKYLLLKEEDLSYKDKKGEINTLNFKDIKSISIKEGRTFFKTMGVCTTLGVILGVVQYPSVKGVALGGAAGIIAGLIVAPFVKKPLTLVYHIGEWKVEKYKP